MKGMKTIILLMLVMALIVIGADAATAAVNVYVNATMPYDIIYQGQIISANVTVENNENFPVRIYSAGAHYDWMPENVFSSIDYGGDYVQVESNGMTSPGELLIQCGDNVSTGYHSFYYKIDLNWYNSYTMTWLNETVVQPGTIYIESPMKPQALQELQFANNTLADARNTTYVSKRAIADIQNATSLLNDGWSAYSANDYDRAVNDSHEVIMLVGYARIAEREYLENSTEVERLVISVSDKLKSVSATSDPDTRSAILEANMYLNQTRQYIDDEDFISAISSVQKADHAADNAINLQFYYFLKANETKAAEGKARSALDRAQASLDNASSMTSASAGGILADARLKMEDATLKFEQGDYTNATMTANVVFTLVDQANEEEASYRMMLARNKIASAGELKSPEAKAMLASASSTYNQSEDDIIAGRYADAIANADAAIKLADDAASEEQKWLDENPLNAIPGFGAMAALLALAAIFIIKERKG
jgi:hypothetical protein